MAQLDELSVAEEADAQRCCVRLVHLAALGTPLKDHAIDWNRRRMDRLLVDHLLRCGYMTTAMELAREAGIEARAAGVVSLAGCRTVVWGSLRGCVRHRAGPDPTVCRRSAYRVQACMRWPKGARRRQPDRAKHSHRRRGAGV